MKIEINFNLHVPDGLVNFAKRWLHRRHLLLGFVILATFSVGVVHAWTQFSPGQVVSSAAVNANFAELQPDKMCVALGGTWNASESPKCSRLGGVPSGAGVIVVWKGQNDTSAPKNLLCPPGYTLKGTLGATMYSGPNPSSGLQPLKYTVSSAPYEADAWLFLCMAPAT